MIDHRVRLLVLDSAAALARSDYGAGGAAAGGLVERQRMLAAQAARLKYLADVLKAGVLVTNQARAGLGVLGGLGGAKTSSLSRVGGKGADLPAGAAAILQSSVRGWSQSVVGGSNRASLRLRGFSGACLRWEPQVPGSSGGRGLRG